MTGRSSDAELAPDLIPLPTSVERREGTFRLTPATTLVAPPLASGEANLLAADLRPSTGLPLPVVTRGDAAGAIRFELAADHGPAVDGAYTLDVTPAGVTARSGSTAGLFYAAQTFRQLLPTAAFSPAPVAGVDWAVPCVRVVDAPRFAWRGLHLDCARHFFPVEFVKRYVDLLAAHKMNRFHWHLTDDQGWRIEIKKYPRLTGVGGRRSSTAVPDPDRPGHLKQDGVPHGGYYTQDQVRDVVAHAAARHVVVVPEIEMPGHAAAAIAAYPDLGVTDQPVSVWTEWGVNQHVLNPTPHTVAFFQDVLAEVLDLFPSTYIHVGGDECPKDEWDRSPAVQARTKALGLTDAHAMQSWFIGQMDEFLSARGRRLIGWDEILDGGLTPGAAVMGWRGDAGTVAAATAAHEVVNASNGFTYLDHYQSADRAAEPYAIGGHLPLARVYDFDPMPPGVPADRHRFVLGGQGQVWSEYIPTPAHVEYMAYPRGCALAERLWSPADPHDFADFRRRLTTHADRLSALGVNFRKLDPVG